jgi:phage-related protein
VFAFCGKSITWANTPVWRKSLAGNEKGLRGYLSPCLLVVVVDLNHRPKDYEPMITIGSGVAEIRVHAENEYRIIYIAKFEEAIYVLHSFTKKTQQTPKRDLDLAAKRFKELQNKRKKNERTIKND